MKSLVFSNKQPEKKQINTSVTNILMLECAGVSTPIDNVPPSVCVCLTGVLASQCVR